MAYIKKADKVQNEEAQDVLNEELPSDISKEESLQRQVDKLTAMLQGFMAGSANQPQVIDTTSKMDRPCTLVHLLECARNLPTVINVNGVNQFFTRFGETHTYRFSEMQNIISRYGEYFERGIFTLGDDCSEFQDEFGIQVIANQIPVSTYDRIETLSLQDFESLIKKINDMQRVNLARTWAQRYQAGKTGYNNPDKIKILNKYTKDKKIFKGGLLAGLLKDVMEEED